MPNRASASPSISSLVDPPYPAATSPSVATQSFFSHQMKMQIQEGHNSVPPSPTANRPAPSPMMNTIVPVQPAPGMATERQPEAWPKAPVPAHFNLGNSVPGPSTIAKKTASNAAHSTASSSAAPSPKPPKPVDVTPPPLPGGSGLMPNGMFGNGPNDGTESRAPTIVLHIPMNGETNRYVNFSRLAEERYGWEALHPRLAAQRERLARVAAAGAALEKNSTHKESGDEMSLDISEGEGDGSNVEMGGMSDGRTGTDGGKKPTKKRKMKEDEYDKDDGFVDDSELLWEEQAAASKDGFFVYSGPLVPEFEKPVLDRFVPRTIFWLALTNKLQVGWCTKTWTWRTWSWCRPWYD
jgi:HPC2 and ubinuclein domain